jgi:hypothetical protein
MTHLNHFIVQSHLTSYVVWLSLNPLVGIGITWRQVYVETEKLYEI